MMAVTRSGFGMVIFVSAVVRLLSVEVDCRSGVNPPPRFMNESFHPLKCGRFSFAKLFGFAGVLHSQDCGKRGVRRGQPVAVLLRSRASLCHRGESERYSARPSGLAPAGTTSANRRPRRFDRPFQGSGSPVAGAPSAYLPSEHRYCLSARTPARDNGMRPASQGHN
jgi:hypothetical protein